MEAGIVQTCSGCTQRGSVLVTDGMCGPFRPVLTAQGIGDQIRNCLLKKGASRYEQKVRRMRQGAESD